MSDVDGPVVARELYSQLFAAGSTLLDPEVIPYALDDAISQLREQDLSPSRWASYVHLGI
jgi:hypothetical protein